MPRLSRKECLKLGMAIAAVERAVSELEDALYNWRTVDADEWAGVLHQNIAETWGILPGFREALELGASEGNTLAVRLREEGRLDTDHVVDWHDSFGDLIGKVRGTAFVMCSEGTAKGAPKEWMPKERGR